VLPELAAIGWNPAGKTLWSVSSLTAGPRLKIAIM
jgi:hypothetical protein